MELLYEIELKYKRDGADSMYSWLSADLGLPCPKVQKRIDLVGLMLSDVSKLVGLGLRESDIFAHLEASLPIPRVRFNINQRVPVHVIGELFNIHVTDCKVQYPHKKNCVVSFKGRRTLVC